jgi:type II secretory pathway component PulF
MKCDREELEKILYRSALGKLRFCALGFVWFLMFCLTDFKSIYNSMNIELPRVTQLMIWASDLLQDFWFVLVPLMWVGWRVWEERALKRLNHTTLEWLARLATIATLTALHQGCWAPFMKLINNVG